MLKKRIYSGLSLAIIMLTSFFMDNDFAVYIFILLSVFWLIGGIYEFFSMTEAIGIKGNFKLTITAGILMLLGVCLCAYQKASLFSQYIDSFILWLFIFLGFLYIFSKKDIKNAFLQHIISIAGLIYICWSLNFIPKIYFIDGFHLNGRYLTFFLVFVTKISDIGAFAAGTITSKRKQGNHKMIPRLSPKKSWEGFIGGNLASIISAVILTLAMGDKLYIHGQQVINIPAAIILAILFSSIGFVGDIAESILKRASNFKDSGTFFPGLGGFLDILDSLIFVAPLFYIYLILQLI